MPAIANPYGRRPFGPPADDSGTTPPSKSVILRMRTAAHRTEVTRELAQGADPASGPELALRAAQLTSRRNRKALARSLRRTIDEAQRPAITRARVVIIRRGQVLDAERAITAMIERLGSAAPVSARGIAIAERILTNAEHSPLYNDSEPGTLRRVIGLATLAMDAAPGQSHEFPIAA